MVPTRLNGLRIHPGSWAWAVLITALAPAMMLRPASADSFMTETSISGLPGTPGSHDLESEFEPGRTLRYTLSLPAAIPRDRSQTLVLVLHYGGPPSGWYGRPLVEQLIAPALDELAAIFVAPVTLGGDWTGADNKRAVMALFAMLESAYATNPAARIITGYSLGGIGTWHFIAQHPGYFAAAVPISGFKPIAAAQCRTPVYAFHSTADSIFDAATVRDGVEALAQAGCDVRIEFLDGVDHFNIGAFAGPLRKAAPWLERTIAGAGGQAL